MPTLAEVRAKYPQYNDMSDGALADALHRKFYSDMPRADFDRALGVTAAPEPGMLDTVRGAVNTGGQVVRGAVDRAAEVVGAPFDLAYRGMEAVGLPRPQGTMTESLKAIGQGVLGGDRPPADTTETFARGAGEGVVDAGTVLVPGMAAARLARAGTLAQRVGTAAATNPVAQTISGAVGGGVTETTDNPWLGAAAALGTPVGLAGVKRAVSPVAGHLNAEQQRLAGVAAQQGIDLTPAQATGSRPLRGLESVFSTLPTTATRQQARQQRQNEQFTRAALRRAGIDGDSADPAVLAAAQQRLGADFQRLSAATTVHFDPAFDTALRGTIARYANRLDSQRRPIFENFVNDIVSGGPRMPGATYQTVRSDLSRLAKNHEVNDPTLSQALRGLRDALDEVADRSVPRDLRGQWREARRQYAALKVIERAMGGTTVAAGSGQIPPTAFSHAVRSQAGRSYARGAGELNDLSRVGTQFVRDPIPNSGTPERLFWQNLMTNPVSLLGGGTAVAFDPVTTAAGVGGALLGPWAAQRAYQSPLIDLWLRNQLFPQRIVTQNTLLGTLAGQGMAPIND
jgi:hypothetical protein